MRVSKSHSAAVSRRAALAGLAASAFAAPAFAQGADSPAHGVRSIEIAASPIDTFSRLSRDTTFGRLTFRGGLVLTSADRDFGGLSGIAIEPNGRSFVAISDEGSWLTADLILTGSKPKAIANARLGPILASNGKPVLRKRDKDCEAVAILDGDLTRGTLLMAFERTHRIERFPVVDRIVQAPVGALRMPLEARQMNANKGLEAMTVMAGGPYKGAVIAYSERFPDADGNHTGWLWVDGEPSRLGLRNIGGFDLTDVASLPDGALIMLERRFRWTEGVRMQLRLIPSAEIAPGRVAEGQILLTADLTSEIDNMEGLAVHRDAAGATVLTLISDDNFNPVLQRTILLQFSFA